MQNYQLFQQAAAFNASLNARCFQANANIAAFVYGTESQQAIDLYQLAFDEASQVGYHYHDVELSPFLIGPLEGG